ncbi:hypothetical protein Sjap_024537 [Stephania japonica]|uniref:Core-2/I-branching beta-1,6-N-acetylglucosaminyltransferase family protein n=1 Tax=Stephania japonica TaxID=461633 RepID=A0AAP0EDK0_9MAGN
MKNNQQRAVPSSMSAKAMYAQFPPLSINSIFHMFLMFIGFGLLVVLVTSQLNCSNFNFQSINISSTFSLIPSTTPTPTNPTTLPSLDESTLSPPPPPPPSPPLPVPPPPPPPSLSLSQESNNRNSGTGSKEFVKPPSANHGMDDKELLQKASKVPRVSQKTKKVAFLFLTKWDLPLGPLWEKFFKGHEGKYSIYVHSDPSFDATALPESSVFHDRYIPSKKVKWGEFSMIEAERRLLASALLDISNERFVLLSEACIPLTDFSTVYNYLMSSSKSFVEVYDKPGPVGRGRYSPRMRPQIQIEQWRKGSQWFEMKRALAIEIVSDVKYYTLFKRYCKAGCYADEHYIPTYVHIKSGRSNYNRSLTWVDWSRGGPHPWKLVRTDVTIERLKSMRHGDCQYNGRSTDVCYLFARKFFPNTLDRLLRFSKQALGF